MASLEKLKRQLSRARIRMHNRRRRTGWAMIRFMRREMGRAYRAMRRSMMVEHFGERRW